MKALVLKTSMLAAVGGIVMTFSSCGVKAPSYSAEGVAFGPDGKPVSYNNGVPVSTRSNQFSPPQSSSSGGGGGGGH